MSNYCGVCRKNYKAKLGSQNDQDKHERSEQHKTALRREADEEFERNSVGIVRKLNEIVTYRKQPATENIHQKTSAAIYSYGDLLNVGNLYLLSGKDMIENWQNNEVNPADDVKVTDQFFPTGVARVIGDRSSITEAEKARDLNEGNKRKSCADQAAMSHNMERIWCNESFWETLQLLSSEKHILFKMICENIINTGDIDRSAFVGDMNPDIGNVGIRMDIRHILMESNLGYWGMNQQQQRDFTNLGCKQYYVQHTPMPDCSLISEEDRLYSATINGKKHTLQVMVIQQWEEMKEYTTVCKFAHFFLNPEAQPKEKITDSLSTSDDEQNKQSKDIKQQRKLVETETKTKTNGESNRMRSDSFKESQTKKQPAPEEETQQQPAVAEQTGGKQNANRPSKDQSSNERNEQKTADIKSKPTQRQPKSKPKIGKELSEKDQLCCELQEQQPEPPSTQDRKIQSNELLKEARDEDGEQTSKISKQQPEAQIRSKPEKTNRVSEEQTPEMLKQTENPSETHTGRQLKEEAPQTKNLSHEQIGRNLEEEQTRTENLSDRQTGRQSGEKPPKTENLSEKQTRTQLKKDLPQTENSSDRQTSSQFKEKQLHKKNESDKQTGRQLKAEPPQTENLSSKQTSTKLKKERPETENASDKKSGRHLKEEPLQTENLSGKQTGRQLKEELPQTENLSHKQTGRKLKEKQPQTENPSDKQTRVQLKEDQPQTDNLSEKQIGRHSKKEQTENASDEEINTQLKEDSPHRENMSDKRTTTGRQLKAEQPEAEITSDKHTTTQLKEEQPETENPSDKQKKKQSQKENTSDKKTKAESMEGQQTPAHTQAVVLQSLGKQTDQQRKDKMKKSDYEEEKTSGAIMTEKVKQQVNTDLRRETVSSVDQKVPEAGNTCLEKDVAATDNVNGDTQVPDKYEGQPGRAELRETVSTDVTGPSQMPLTSPLTVTSSDMTSSSDRYLAMLIQQVRSELESHRKELSILSADCEANHQKVLDCKASFDQGWERLRARFQHSFPLIKTNGVKSSETHSVSPNS